MSEELDGGWTLENDGSVWSPSAEWNISPEDADGEIEIEGHGRWVYVPRTVMARVVIPPRPWHYVTEKLPEAGQSLRFWLRGQRSSCTGHYDPGFLSGPWRLVLAGVGYRLDDGQGGVYAWEPEPEPPPLPEALPSADEVYGILSTAHPVSGGAGFDQDGKEAAGPPADPDLLQALKDAARMGRKRPGVKP